MNTNPTILNFEYGVAATMNSEQLMTSTDEACFEEIKTILKKHNALQRFGVTLISNETLPSDKTRMETNSAKDRTLITQIVDKKKYKGQAIETNWKLNTIEAIATCEQSCMSTGGNNYKTKRHLQNHKKTNE